MRAGQLRHTIEIQQKTKTADGMGSFTESWSEFATVRAAIWPVSAKEIISNQQNKQQITSKIRIRFLEGVTASMRVLFGTRRLEIVAPPINPDEKNIMLDLLCSEVTA